LRGEHLGRQCLLQLDDAELRVGGANIGRPGLAREAESMAIPSDFGMALEEFLVVHG
jgi:hypothetical protein